jgi:hypothetical protein
MVDGIEWNVSLRFDQTLPGQFIMYLSIIDLWMSKCKIVKRMFVFDASFNDH